MSQRPKRVFQLRKTGMGKPASSSRDPKTPEAESVQQETLQQQPSQFNETIQESQQEKT